MKIKKYDLIPLLLFIYNILVIVLLRFVLKRRERYRKEMKERNNKILSQQENTPKDQE